MIEIKHLLCIEIKRKSGMVIIINQLLPSKQNATFCIVTQYQQEVITATMKTIYVFLPLHSFYEFRNNIDLYHVTNIILLSFFFFCFL